MTDMIKDGTGQGFAAKVDSQGRLYVRGISVGEMTHAVGDEESGYGIGTPLLTLTTTGGRVLRLVNNAEEEPYILQSFLLSWNGGNTNFNRPCEVSIYFKEGAPTANATAVTPLNLAIGSTHTPNLAGHVWDSVGDGMTGMGAGIGPFVLILAPGLAYLNLDGTVELKPGQSLSINAKGTEVGKFSAVVKGYFT